MEWFKHDTSALNDAKIKKLIIRYGVTGYAIYFHCIELIAGDVNKNNLTFELEHDSEIIADNLKIKGNANKSGIEIVEEIMRYIIELNLFQENENRIFCLKLLKRIDSSMTSNTQFRKMINDAKEHHDGVMTGSCKKRIEKNRKEKNKEEKNIYKSELFDKLWNTYDKKTNKEQAIKAFKKIQTFPIDIEQRIINYVKSTPEKKYRKNFATWLNGKCWNDEIINISNEKEIEYKELPNLKEA